MRLGTMLGGKARAEIDRAAKEQQRQQSEAKRKEAAERKRRSELADMGFRPV